MTTKRRAPEKRAMWSWKKNLEIMGFDVTLFSQPFRARQTRGIPDMYIRSHRFGVRLWIEAKAGRKKPTPEQAAWLEYERRSGGAAIVAYSLDDILAELHRLGVPIS